eukprot:5624535-Prymnesium_polylepis.1
MLEKELEIMIAATKGCRSVCVLYGTIERRAPPTRALLNPSRPPNPEPEPIPPRAPGRASRLGIVMKLYAGTLEEEIEASPAGLPLPRMLDASAQIARAIAELAAVHIVIQDLKPSNLLVNDVAAAG